MKIYKKKIILNKMTSDYDKDYFNKMRIEKIKIYFKIYPTYEQFILKEKFNFVTKEKYNEWLHTVHFMSLEVDNMSSKINQFFGTYITLEGIKYNHDNIKVLMKNFQKYKEDEIKNIGKEFANLYNLNLKL